MSSRTVGSVRESLLHWIPDGRHIWEIIRGEDKSTDGQWTDGQAETMLRSCLDYRTEGGLTLCQLFAQKWYGRKLLPEFDIVRVLLRLTEPESDVDALDAVIPRLKEEAFVVAEQKAWADAIGYKVVMTLVSFGLSRDMVSVILERVHGAHWKDVRRQAETRIPKIMALEEALGSWGLNPGNISTLVECIRPATFRPLS